MSILGQMWWWRRSLNRAAGRELCEYLTKELDAMHMMLVILGAAPPHGGFSQALSRAAGKIL
jgi:hypothetical protein